MIIIFIVIGVGGTSLMNNSVLLNNVKRINMLRNKYNKNFSKILKSKKKSKKHLMLLKIENKINMEIIIRMNRIGVLAKDPCPASYVKFSCEECPGFIKNVRNTNCRPKSYIHKTVVVGPHDGGEKCFIKDFMRINFTEIV